MAVERLDNGILSRIPGEYIAQGAKTLPPPEQHQGEALTAVVDTGPGWHGLVRIRYVSTCMKHRRHRHCAWVAEHAERVG